MNGTSSRFALEAAVALFLFGCIPVAVRAVSANAFTIGVFRLGIAAAGLLAIAIVRRTENLLPRHRADLGRLIVIGFFFFGHLLAFFLSVKTSTASIGSIGLSTYGVFLILFGARFGGHPLRPIELGAVLVAATGAIIVIPRFDLRNNVAVGMLLAIVSAVFYAALPILHRKWSHIPTGSRAIGQFTFGFLFFLLLLPWTDWNLSSRDWQGLWFLAIGPTLIGHTLWVRVTTALRPALTSVIYYGNIPVAVALAVALLGEPVTPRTMVGAAMIIGGGIVGLLARSREEK